MSFLRYLDIEQLLILKNDVESELSRRNNPRYISDLAKRAERFGIPYYGSQNDELLSQSLSSSRKKSAQYSDDTRIIKRNREQREAFVKALDEELDAYAAERDRIMAKREKLFDWHSILENSE